MRLLVSVRLRHVVTLYLVGVLLLKVLAECRASGAVGRWSLYVVEAPVAFAVLACPVVVCRCSPVAEKA